MRPASRWSRRPRLRLRRRAAAAGPLEGTQAIRVLAQHRHRAAADSHRLEKVSVQRRRGRRQRVEGPQPALDGRHQARAPQVRKVPRGRGLRDVQRLHQVADAELAAPEKVQDAQAHRFRQGAKQQAGSLGGILHSPRRIQSVASPVNTLQASTQAGGSCYTECGPLPGVRRMEWTEESVRRRQKELLFPNVSTYYQEPLVVESAKGLTVRDVDGREYLDFFGGILTVSVGHCHPRVTEAVIEQQKRLVHVSTLYPTVPQIELAEKLVQLRPMKEPAKVFFTNSGTEANETAVQLAKVATGRTDLIALRHSYGGRGALAVNMMGNKNYRPLQSEIPGIKHAHAPYCYRCDFGLKYPDCGLACAKDIKNLIETTTTGQIAGFIAEPIMGVGGFIVPPKEYFEIAVPIIRNAGGLFIADEVQTAWGRTGEKWWGVQHFGVEPDILTSAKGMANGQPIGLTMAKAQIADK